MKINIYAVIILLVNFSFSVFAIHKSNTYQTPSKDSINQIDSVFSIKIFDKK